MARLDLGKVVGNSAYEEAVEHGYSGTEEEWLESLKGDKGDPGTTDYNELINKPTLFSGDYDDLTNKPTIPSTASDIGAMDASDYDSETWTFTLSDDSTVTKKVVIEL